MDNDRKINKDENKADNTKIATARDNFLIIKNIYKNNTFGYDHLIQDFPCAISKFSDNRKDKKDQKLLEYKSILLATCRVDGGGDTFSICWSSSAHPMIGFCKYQNKLIDQEKINQLDDLLLKFDIPGKEQYDIKSEGDIGEFFYYRVVEPGLKLLVKLGYKWLIKVGKNPSILMAIGDNINSDKSANDIKSKTWFDDLLIDGQSTYKRSWKEVPDGPSERLDSLLIDRLSISQPFLNFQDFLILIQSTKN
jgi:hypothetical protein